MEDNMSNNFVELCGVCAAAPAFSHRSREEDYFVFPLETRRLSGAVDRLNVVVGRDMPLTDRIREGDTVTVRGELRSFNNKSGVGARLVISVFARELEPGGEPDRNVIRLCGSLCQTPNYRRTPMGREICDLMLAVNRRYGRADYLPCIAWGVNARRLSGLSVGARINAEGRVQSRKYIKVTDGDALEKTAYEVSITKAELA